MVSQPGKKSLCSTQMVHPARANLGFHTLPPLPHLKGHQSITRLSPSISSGFPDKLIYSWVKRGIFNVIKSLFAQEHNTTAWIDANLDLSRAWTISPWHLPLGRRIPTWGLLAIFLVTSCSGNLDMLWYCRLQDLRAEFYLFPKDDEEPQDTKFQIDGSYIPRIFILGE